MLTRITYKGGQPVRFGFYLNLVEWDAKIVPPEGGTLEGTPETAWVRLPLVAVLVLAPIMGAAFALFLPFIGFAMVAMYLAGRLRRLFTTTPPAVANAAGVLPASATEEAGTGETRKAA